MKPRAPYASPRSILTVLMPVLTGLGLIAVAFAAVPALTARTTPAALEPLTFSVAVAPSLRGCAQGGCHDARPPVLRGVLANDERSRREAFEAARAYVIPGDYVDSKLYLRAMGLGSCAPARLTAGGCEARALAHWIGGHPVHPCFSH